MKSCSTCARGGKSPDGTIMCGAGVDDAALKEGLAGDNPIWAIRKYGRAGIAAMFASGRMPKGSDGERMAPTDGAECAVWQCAVVGDSLRFLDLEVIEIRDLSGGEFAHALITVGGARRELVEGLPTTVYSLTCNGRPDQAHALMIYDKVFDAGHGQFKVTRLSESLFSPMGNYVEIEVMEVSRPHGQ